jgi:hypothetical protein
MRPALPADSDVLMGVSDSSGMRRIAAARGPGGWTVEERWTSIGLSPYFNNCVVHEGHAFGFDGSILACIDLKDGNRKWKGGRYGNTASSSSFPIRICCLCYRKKVSSRW